ncbi:RluA family pseudouridine synthase [Adlercreutzia sp. ZJ141]|uniref:RluA family pseudouridine synthase n=1 Tax=Adlercreutzia sp. ZJ141 TaxID=2709406 RepID=UPI0013ED8F17|nr:RluA family pseudouridine synthase [Adlercreutzia sp. ZJ141]
MTHYKSHTVRREQAGDRLDSLLSAVGAYSSRSAAAKAVEGGRVLVNGAEVAKKHLVRAGDVVVYELDCEVLAGVVEGERIPLDIRFEDDHLLVLSKQAGLVCHPSVDHFGGTLVNALVYHCGFEHLCNVQGDDDRLGIVHRLDRDTTGLMLAAKDDATGYALMADIRDRAVDRRYLALVHGVIAADTGMIDAPIARSDRDRLRMAVRDVPSARDAVTTFRVLERFDPKGKDDGYTLIDCKLFTGRTHQIRVHMEYTKHPLVGDPVYTACAPGNPAAGLGLYRQFLHSFKLGFDHPMTGERLAFADRLPDDLQQAFDGLADRSCGRTAAGAEVFDELDAAPAPSLSAIAAMDEIRSGT